MTPCSLYRQCPLWSRAFGFWLASWSRPIQLSNAAMCYAQMSDVLKPLHLKVAFGRKYRFHNVDFPGRGSAAQRLRKGFLIYVAEASRKGYDSITEARNASFPSRTEANTIFNPFLNTPKQRGSDSLFKPLAEGTFHAAQAPRKPSRKGFDISLRPQLGLEHCCNDRRCVFMNRTHLLNNTC